MRITQALLGEHGAIYPLFKLIEETTASADLMEIKVRTHSLKSAIGSHAKIEDELLRPAIQAYLPAPPRAADGKIPPTDHEVIEAGLSKVLAAMGVEDARRTLLETVAIARKHFLKEESLVFGIASRELSREVQEQLGAEWARRRGVTLA